MAKEFVGLVMNFCCKLDSWGAILVDLADKLLIFAGLQPTRFPGNHARFIACPTGG
jgi:hypothetical protein